MGHVNNWQLFVDESGAFGCQGDTVVVAGVLVHESLREAQHNALLASLRDVAPGLPWPHHARYFSKPAFIALSWLHYLETTEGDERHNPDHLRLAQQSENFRSWLVHWRPDLFAALMESMRQNQEPDFELLVYINRELRRARRPTFDALHYYVLLMHSTLSEVLVRLSACAQERVRTRDMPAFTLIACGESAQHDMQRPYNDLPVHEDRYLTLLTCLLDRAADMLRRVPGEHRVGLHVLTRNVFEPVLEREVPLHPRIMGTVISTLRETAPTLLEHVRLVTEAVPAFDRQVHPLLVVADWVANLTRATLLGGNSHNLASLEEKLATLFGVDFRSGAPKQSHLTATGKAWSYLINVRQRSLDKRNSQQAWTWDGVVPWAREQAEQWATPRGAKT